MNIKPLLLVLLLLKAFSLFASGTDTLKIFYPINQYGIPEGDRTKIAAFAATLNHTDTLTAIGYADYLGSSAANITLSQNRAMVIKQFVLGINKTLVIVTEGRGAVPSIAARSALGEPNSRRVDIIIHTPPASKKIAANPPVPKSDVKFPIKTSDTVATQTPPEPTIELTPVDKATFEDKVNSIDKLDVGGSISLEELTFKMGEHFLNPEAVPYVTTLLRYLKKHKNIRFEIRGHICCVFGDMDGYDRTTNEQTLSFNRAKFIYDYFIKKGIAANRMTYTGVGASKPKVWPEKSARDGYLNRRVEIIVTGK